tara:strand:- start:191 stop:769 length:579 start_codon:yes stop_codon:yes gene_type:complete
MRPILDFIVKPIGDRYNNSVKVGEKSLILNTEIFNHSYINRRAEVVSTPMHNPLNIQVGDELIIHHNVFRRWHNMKGVEKNGRGFLKEGEFLLQNDQFFMYGKPNDRKVVPGFTFIKPLKSEDNFSNDDEIPLMGVVKHSHAFDKGALVGFSPGDEFEFVVDEERLYRVMDKFINIEYEYKGNEEEYNPSWA